MPLGKVTLGSGATQVQATGRAMQLLLWQGADASYAGDSSSVSAADGIPVAAASTTVGPTRIGPFTSGAINLNEWYVVGTDGDVVYFQYTPEE